MVTQPEYVKMMGIPESIPPDLRAVMNHCLEVNKVRRCTAEEAIVRLQESESIYFRGSSTKEKYLANLSSVASAQGAYQLPFINNLIEQSGSSKCHLAQIAIKDIGTSFHKDITRGPEAVRFERKTSRIFQELKRIEAQKTAATCLTPQSESVSADIVESPQVDISAFSYEPAQQSRNFIQDCTYPYASLLGKLAQEFKSQPAQNSVLSSTLQQVKEMPVASKQIPESLGNFDKTKSLSNISRQKSRTKVRQKSYDRTPNTPKKSVKVNFNTSNNDNKTKTSTKVSDSSQVVESNTLKLWPISSDVSIHEGCDPTLSLLSTKEDDMDCFIDVFDPEAFQLENEDGITHYMFELVEKQENEEGPESIRIDMDEMSLTGAEGNHRNITKRVEYQEMGIVNKEKNSDIDVSVSEVLPNFDLLS